MSKILDSRKLPTTALEKGKLEKEIEKSSLEVEVLRFQTSRRGRILEHIRAFSGFAPAFVGLAAVVTATFSFYTWVKQQDEAAKTRREERFYQSLLSLSDPAAEKRYAAVNSLRSFITPENDEQTGQVLSALVSDLSVETSSHTRDTIISILNNLDASQVKKETLHTILKQLVDQNRALVSETGLRFGRPRFQVELTGRFQSGGNMQSLADAIVSLLKKGVKTNDLTGIYLGNENLDDINIDGVRFDKSVLAWTSFNGASLQDTSFEDADLESVRFIAANLRSAKFHASDPLKFKFQGDFVLNQMNRAQAQNSRIYISLPEFNCADLRNADFDGFPLFALYKNDVDQNVIGIDTSRFIHADLQNADLSKARFIFWAKMDQNDGTFTKQFPFPMFSSASSVPLSSGYIGAVIGRNMSGVEAPGTANQDLGEYSRAFESIAISLQDTNMQFAKLPNILSIYFMVHPMASTNAVGPKSGLCDRDLR